MKNLKRKWDLLTKEERNSHIKAIIFYFEKERDDKIGVLASEDILDFFLQLIGEGIYNKSIEDAKKLLKERFIDFEVDLDLLKTK